MTKSTPGLMRGDQRPLLTDTSSKRHLDSAERDELLQELTSPDDDESAAMQTQQGTIPTDTDKFTQLLYQNNDDDEENE